MLEYKLNVRFFLKLIVTHHTTSEHQCIVNGIIKWNALQIKFKLMRTSARDIF